MFPEIPPSPRRETADGAKPLHIGASADISIHPGYYDVSFDETWQEWGEDGPIGPEVVQRVVWLGARVLLIDVNGDAIVEHYPLGWRGALRRIDRIPAAHVGTTYLFSLVVLPDVVS